MNASLSGKAVLVTGADGFIGSHLTERLVRDGARTRAFCLYNSNGSWGWLDESEPAIKHEIEVHLGDIRDARFVEHACQGVDIVFHLAALISIPYSYRAAQSFVETNILGTLNVLEAVRRSGCQRLVHTSTSEVYGTPDRLPIEETHPLKGQSPYSASKIGADKLCEAFHCTFAVPVVVLRPFNTYGPRQSSRAIVPTILTQLLRGAAEVRLGNLSPRRDLTYVADTVDGLLRAGITADMEGRTIQLGTGAAVSIGELFAACCQLLGASATVVQETQRLRPDKSEVMVLEARNQLARELLAWQPRTALADGLAHTADWLRHNLERYDIGQYQI